MSTLIDTAPIETNGAHYRRERQPSDVIARKYETFPAHQREALLWLHGHGDRHELSTAAMGELIGYDKAVISVLFSKDGVYKGNLDNVADAIAEARDRIAAEEKSGSRRTPFIECNLSRHIWALCDRARDYQRIVFMYAETQAGKSRNLKEKAKREEGSVFYWEMPVGGSLHNFLANAAESLGMSPQKKTAELRRRIIGRMKRPANGKPMLVIIDQMHRAFSDAQDKMSDKLTRAQLSTLDFIIEMFDEHEPGIVLCGTPIFRDGMKQLANRGFFEQLKRRALNKEGFPLPAKPLPADLNIFARHYGLQPAAGAALQLQTRVIEESGLGMWITLLSMASHRAKKNKKPMTWEHVIDADDFLAAAAKGKISIEGEKN